MTDRAATNDRYAAVLERLNNGELILLDGGTGTELERRGAAMTDGSWCGANGISDQQLLQKIHEDYIAAGSDVIIANTYASSRHILERGGWGDRFEEANRNSVEAALAARTASGRSDVLVAGSISTTRQEAEQATIEVARKNHPDQAALLAEAGCDLIIAEMMRDIDHTTIVLDAIRDVGLPLWVGFTTVEQDGEVLLYDRDHRFDDALAQIDLSGADMVSIMHTEVAETAAALEILAKYWDGPTGAYCQTGSFIPPNWQFIDTITPEAYTTEAQSWIDHGLQVVGGCCGIGPEHIECMAASLRAE